MCLYVICVYFNSENTTLICIFIANVDEGTTYIPTIKTRIMQDKYYKKYTTEINSIYSFDVDVEVIFFFQIDP